MSDAPSIRRMFCLCAVQGVCALVVFVCALLLWHDGSFSIALLFFVSSSLAGVKTIDNLRWTWLYQKKLAHLADLQRLVEALQRLRTERKIK